LKGVAAEGQMLFNNAGQCAFCHVNAGASSALHQGQNPNFDTNVEGLLPHPGPPDGGFGRTGTRVGGGIGNGTFNTPGLVEAADTGPFFHNNSVSTIEDAVNFYTTTTFNSSPANFIVGNITLTPTQVGAVAAFLRTINALENIRSSIDLGERAKRQRPAPANELLKLSVSELDDAIGVLSGGALILSPEAQSARGKLVTARAFVNQAIETADQSQRDALINQAIPQQRAARADLIN
jgi:hypothetical protein